VSDHQPREVGRGHRAVAPILLAASLLCVTVSTRSLEGVPESLGLTVFGFFQRSFSTVGSFVSDTVSSIAELRRLRDNYRELSAKLERYTNMERGIAELRDENKRLKEQLGFSEEIAYQRIAARIVAKDPENLYSTITIDKGFGEGIRKNMPVIAFQDGVEGLVGRVVEVGRGTSKIVPLYDIKSFVAARLSGGSRTEGLVGGQGSPDDPLLMRFVKKRAKDEIQFGDMVVTTGFESVYPSEVAVGRVKKVRVLDYQTSIDIELDPVLDFSRLEYVFVVRPEADGPDTAAPQDASSDAAGTAEQSGSKKP
jgi:rod shape-determining protein MreC